MLLIIAAQADVPVAQLAINLQYVNITKERKKFMGYRYARKKTISGKAIQ